MLAPIVLFVYNRPIHTQKTLDALSQNDLASDSDLYIYSDAAKTINEEHNVSEVRKLIKSIKGFKSVTIIEAEKNLGLASSIIQGVTHICDRYGKIIVLEDDILVSKYFLDFMNQSLEIYQNDDKVMHISGCTYPIDISICNSMETFFFRVPLCWGWATWSRAWKLFERDISVIDKFTEADKFQFNIENTQPYFTQLEQNKSGEIKSWFVFWYAILFFNNGLSLFPARSLANNIGFDGTGVHCDNSSTYNTEINNTGINIMRLDINEDAKIISAHKKYFKDKVTGVRVRLSNKLKKIMTHLHGVKK